MTMRPVKVVRCLIPDCHNTTTTSGYRPKRCLSCKRAKWRQEAAGKHLRKTGQLRRRYEVWDDSAATIERNFQSALKQAKRTEREQLWGWSSPLSRL